MTRFAALTRREVGHLFMMPALYVVTAFFVLLYGIIFFLSPVTEGEAEFSSVILFILYMSITFGPLITMQSFAGETQSGTLELLMTAPVRPWEIVLSKFLGAMGFYLASLSPCVIYISLLQHYGNLDRGVIFTSMLGLVLAGSTFIAVGILASSFTMNQIVAAATSCTSLIILFLLAYSPAGGAWYERFLYHLAFLPHFEGSFLRGEIDTRDIVYFASLIFGVLFMTWVRISSRGLFTQTRKAHRGLLLSAGITLAVGITLVFGGVAYVHVNTTSLAVLKTLWAAHDVPGILREGWLVASGLLTVLLAFGLWVAARRVVGIPPAAATPLPIPKNTTTTTASQKSMPSPKKRLGLAVWLAVASMLIILLNGNFISSYFYKKWDLSDSQENSLSLDARKTLDALDGKVEITVFLSRSRNYKDAPPDKEAVTKKLVQDMKDLLTQFSDYSAKVHYEMLDPIADGNTAIQRATELNLPTENLTELVCVRYNDGRTTVLQARQLLKDPSAIAQMKGYKTKSFNGEFALTHTLRLLMDPRQTRIFFSTGKGEYSIHGRAAKHRSLAKLAYELRMRSFVVQSLLIDPQAVSQLEQGDILIMGGPVVPLSEELLTAVDDFVGRGGRLIFLLPSVSQSIANTLDTPESQQALVKQMTRWGVRPRFDLVLDNMSNANDVNSHIIARLGGAEEVLTQQRQPGVLLPSARSLRIDPDMEKKTGWRAQPILMSAQSAYSIERRRDKKGGRSTFKNRSQGAKAMAAFCIREKTAEHREGRIIIVGNTDFANDVWLAGGEGKWANDAFMHRLVELMTSRDYNTKIKPRKIIDRSFRLTAAQHKTVGWLSMALPPYLWLLLGIGVWWVRKQ